MKKNSLDADKDIWQHSTHTLDKHSQQINSRGDVLSVTKDIQETSTDTLWEWDNGEIISASSEIMSASIHDILLNEHSVVYRSIKQGVK